MSSTGVESVGEAQQVRPQPGAAESGEANVNHTSKLLRAVESYKAACAAKGLEPTGEGSWSVLLAALNAERD